MPHFRVSFSSYSTFAKIWGEMWTEYVGFSVVAAHMLNAFPFEAQLAFSLVSSASLFQIGFQIGCR